MHLGCPKSLNAVHEFTLKGMQAHSACTVRFDAALREDVCNDGNDLIGDLAEGPYQTACSRTVLKWTMHQAYPGFIATVGAAYLRSCMKLSPAMPKALNEISLEPAPFMTHPRSKF